MGQLRKYFSAKKKAESGLLLPSSIKFAREARKHNRHVYVELAKKKGKGKKFSFFNI
jgi:hypothetical protein